MVYDASSMSAVVCGLKTTTIAAVMLRARARNFGRSTCRFDVIFVERQNVGSRHFRSTFVSNNFLLSACRRRAAKSHLTRSRKDADCRRRLISAPSPLQNVRMRACFQLASARRRPTRLCDRKTRSSTSKRAYERAKSASMFRAQFFFVFSRR